ncbi:hypothetical protein [Erwinia sp. JUb26]|uniref:hypothetical protein n=1 Tax=Erwinia sp. JUb26 TaxID=2485126 RepID=UPI000F91D13C|nr:hypothetical protein [Erwinia sp. JUb26]ROR15066.1 hypothetical protein EC836_101566 [Erwinia sp. JUb26]
MKIKLLLSLALPLVIIACSEKKPPQPHEETPACRNYRMMMTAPIPPDVHNRLKLACEASMAE